MPGRKRGEAEHAIRASRRER